MLESAQIWWNPSYANKYDYNLVRGKAAYIIPQFNRYIKEYYPGTELALTEFGVDSAVGIKHDPLVEPMYMERKPARKYELAAKGIKSPKSIVLCPKSESKG